MSAFYVNGEIWKTHGDAANATMADSTNALLLRPVSAESEFPTPTARPPVGASELPSSRITATICHLNAPVDEEFTRFFDRRVRPVPAEAGAAPIAWFETEPAANTFPRLPVREGEHVFIWFTRFTSTGHLADHLDRLARAAQWVKEVRPGLEEHLSAPPERLRLAPTARSSLR